MKSENKRVLELWRQRPRDRFVRGSLYLLGVIMLTAVLLVGASFGDLFSARRISNLRSFLGEILPAPLRGEEFDLGALAAWFGDLFFSEKGGTAALQTLAISVVAIVLAGGIALLLAPLAARTLSSAESYLPASENTSPRGKRLWTVMVSGVRFFFVSLRAIPEYVLAFILFTIFGNSAWPAVFALVIHNTGILGRLNADTIENLDQRTLMALRGLGANRRQIMSHAIFPTALPRFLVYFFYRWETCVREATVLGMLGILSLGYWIDDAWHAQRHDEMFALILLGSAIVLVGDLISAILRGMVRRA